MSTANKSIKRNIQLPVHSITIEIYSSIALFLGDSTAFSYLNIVLLIGLELSLVTL